ncbi:MAG: hypothetical protein ACRDHL_05905 [Candidatus Promineifilaceae bacterium]
MSDNHQLHRVFVDIAGMVVCLEAEDDQLAAAVRGRYGLFLGAPPALLHITLKTAPDALYIRPQAGPWVIETRYRGRTLHYRSYLEEGRIDFGAGRGQMTLAPQAHVENFLRAVYAWLCLQNGALLLHAAGVVRGGLGYAFFGPSGAGKSTTARLSAASGEVVSDDLVILRSRAGGVRLHGVPFKGTYADVPRANQAAPLVGLFRLRQAKSHFLRPLGRPQAVAHLVAQAPFVCREPALAAQLVSVCGRIAELTPVMEMHFKPDEGFWKLIDEHLEPVP